MSRMLASTGGLTTKGYVIRGTSSMNEEGKAYVRVRTITFLPNSDARW